MNPEWLIQEKRRLRFVKKLIAVHMKGSQCALCGSRELQELEFHHPFKDRLYEAGLTTLSFKQIFEEMPKVLLLCSRCHAVLDDDRKCNQNEVPNCSPPIARSFPDSEGLARGLKIDL
jgi:DNA-directed RNA polymerase subunit RPC12/RpoP